MALPAAGDLAVGHLRPGGDVGGLRGPAARQAWGGRGRGWCGWWWTVGLGGLGVEGFRNDYCVPQTLLLNSGLHLVL